MRISRVLRRWSERPTLNRAVNGIPQFQASLQGLAGRVSRSSPSPCVGSAQALDQLREDNRQLRLAQAELSEPARIDMMARQLGLTAPQPGQVIHPNAAGIDSSAPVEARMAPPAAPAK